MNRINKVLKEKKNILSIYFTAGYPNINDTEEIITKLSECDVDMIEIGLPFSDPLADGPTIQESSTIALNNGMNSIKLFDQLKEIRKKTDIPLIIMGYFNPILQFGVEEFCKKCNTVGIDGLIIPDLPVEIFEKDYKHIFDENNLLNMFLITPQTSNERIRFIDKVSKGFIYMVSSFSITGAVNSFDENQKKYFKRINSMDLNSKLLIGFGISNNKTFLDAIKNSRGAIIGSAFIKFIKNNGKENIAEFINSIRGKSSSKH
ncbi:tryptophan synthase subunit alpha [Flavobacteriaceae bacterium]|jgi:tryptophan synthase alpha chain|nr:tryptophan synthase subunit alpha [Flavobacteriaceae bacterium]MDB4086104.1 tryptophan synthase subunit alpha [Flavobacteriaceae bacterium]MDB4239600.1 tryptophan synthase subunit alpha [Flavobacteriaceae bacterium]MDB9787842.1 tryptophan synthase subunit alpha [Flavobacteriaceae bacterium]MDC0958761.1 tryptophan synthase subunit alpha [Flavobacteriaceae bacterium]